MTRQAYCRKREIVLKFGVAKNLFLGQCNIINNNDNNDREIKRKIDTAKIVVLVENLRISPNYEN